MRNVLPMTSEFRLHAEHREVVAGNQLAPNALGTIIQAYAEVRRSCDQQAGEVRQVVAVIPVRRIRDGQMIPVRGNRLKANQFLGVRVILKYSPLFLCFRFCLTGLYEA